MINKCQIFVSMSACFFYVVLSCERRDLVMGRYRVQEVLPKYPKAFTALGVHSDTKQTSSPNP